MYPGPQSPEQNGREHTPGSDCPGVDGAGPPPHADQVLVREPHTWEHGSWKGPCLQPSRPWHRVPSLSTLQTRPVQNVTAVTS